MNDKKPASSWDDLITQIGAKPAADALERKRPAIETTFAPPPTVDPTAVKPKPGDWNALANELGVEVPAEPEAPKSARTPVESRGPTSSALEAGLAEIEPIESDFEEIVDEEIEFEEVDYEEDEDVESDIVGRQEPNDDEESTSLSGDAARNAFEALFDAGSFAALPPVRKPKPRPPEPARGGPQWRDPDAPRPAGEDSDSAFDDLGAVAESEDAGEESTAKEGEGDRPRRRRRRRRGRGRDESRGESARGEARTPAARAESWEEPSDEASVEDDAEEEGVEGEDRAEGEERPAKRRRRRRRRTGRSGEGETRSDDGLETGDGLDASDDEDEDEDGEESRGPRAEPLHDDDGDDDDGDLPRESHKNIPTWSDAISVMVEANLQSRKDSPSRPSSPRGRGRGRGRGGSGGNGAGSGGRRGRP